MNIIFYICIFLLIIAFFYVLNIKVKDLKQNREEEQRIRNAINVLQNEELDAKRRKEQYDKEILVCETRINRMNEILDNQKTLSQKAFESYMDTLSQEYKDKSQEYQVLLNNLQESYDRQQQSLIAETEDVKKDLDKIKATRAATIEAQLREKKIKEQSSFYCLKISDSDIADIQKLENIKKTLNKPRVLSMLIWQTWFQKPLKALTANVLSTSESVTGIYKITNIITNECYIGQAVNIATRWAEHAKCGLGIDTPAGNKLYAAMQEYGLQSFSWEVLEQCGIEELNEKERYYINLYDSVNYGYNILRGNK